VLQKHIGQYSFSIPSDLLLSPLCFFPRHTQQFQILFTAEVHDTLGRLLLLLKSNGVQSITWRGSLLESIRYTCPNHLSQCLLMIDSKVSCPVLSRTRPTLFVTLSFQLIFKIFLCYLWWAASSFLVLVTLTDHISAPTRSSKKIIKINKIVKTWKSLSKMLKGVTEGLVLEFSLNE